MIRLLVALLGLMITGLPAQASEAATNGLVILPADTARPIAAVAMDGSDNRLVIEQRGTAGGEAANRISVRIEGDGNGGPTPGAPAPAPLIDGLGWGSLLQEGEGNRMDLGVSGSDNLFALMQSGTGNTVVASITGIGNQAAVQQVGSNNIASFSQSGRGNMMSITQRSW